MKATKKKNDKKPLIILTAGGTGGHVYPAEALADELEKRGYRLVLITDNRGKDNYKGKLGQIPNFSVLSGGVVGKSKITKVKNLLKTCVGVLQAGLVLFKQKPVCVIGFGGYASFPASMAAILLGVDLVIHEQNSVMSRTNRFLSKYASLVAQSFRNVKHTPAHVKTVLTGMPVRSNIVEIKDKPYSFLGKADKFQIIVLGGSQGAKIFGEVIPEAIKSLDEKTQKKIKLIQQCRKADLEEVKSAYKNVSAEVELSDFFNNMPELYTSSHLIISRAGASSVSEIAVVGIPSVLVPLPTAADDHQTYNAKEISDVEGGVVFKQKDFTSKALKKLLEDLFADYQKLCKMASCAKKVGIVDAASRFADAVEKEIISKK